MTKTEALVAQINKLVAELAAITAAPTASSVPSNQKKLTKREVAHIRELKRNGFTHQAIADIYDVNRATVTRIINKTYWK